MIAEIIPAAYDIEGRQVYRPSKRKHRIFSPTFPIGRFVSQPLAHVCSTLTDLRARLCTFRYVSDEEQWGRDDYWCPPDEFEKLGKGDCEDFAFWTWRQLMAMGYETRFVAGAAGRYGDGHAWVTFQRAGRHFLVEPQAALLGEWLPRLSAVRYVPHVSMERKGIGFRYFAHDPKTFNPPLAEAVALGSEWASFYVRIWGRVASRLPTASTRLLKRLLPFR